ncbi:hypothetical protein SAMN06265350_1141 [Solitalea koreensis]|uniref:DUF4890 domain-containing protein n=2 Tax=Solitalea koreensis TaxID=543615 RepID=A0A521EE65_9SPHI|nr:hypothetical protein SAMN06265350_1141 [Solitalea koreensis]
MLFLFTRVQAQQTIPTAEERSTKLTEWMKTNLHLTAEQVPKVHDINLKYAKKTDDLMLGNHSKEDKMHITKVNNQAKEGELKMVFTEDQFKTYKAKKEEMKKEIQDEMKKQ